MKSLALFCSHYLLTLSTLAYGSGILLNSTATIPQNLLLILFAAFLTVILLLRAAGRHPLAPLLVPLLFICFGMTQASVNHLALVDDSHLVVSAGNGQEAVLVGTLAELVADFGESSRAAVELEYAKIDGAQPFMEVSGRILLLVEGRWPESIRPGQSIIVRTTLHFPRASSVPGSFDYRKFLARENIFLTGLVASPALIQPVKDMEPDWARSLLYRIEGMRTLIGCYLERNLSEREASLYQALLIGDRSSLSPEVEEILKGAGIMHLWAISGLHLGLLSLFSYSVIYWLLRRSPRCILSFNVRKCALLLTLPLLLFYSLLAGFQPPAARAFIMTFCVVAALCWDRSHSALAPLSGAALLILLVDPMAVESPSFQLSFCAVASLIVGMVRVAPTSGSTLGKARDLLRPAVHMLFSLICVTIVATLGTLPLLLFHFNRLSLVTLPANILIQPLICFFSLPLGMVSLPFILFDQAAAVILLKTGAYGLHASLGIAETLTSSDATQIWAPTPSPVLMLVYYLLFFALAAGRFPGMVRVLMIITYISVVGLLLDYIPSQDMLGAPATRVTVLSVGHGSANLVELASGRVVLIDGGAQSGPGFDCGARLIAPYLWHEGIGRIDDIFITHDDSDHYSGIYTLIKRFNPERLWLPHLNEAKNGYSRLVDLARRRGLQIMVPEPGVLIDEAGSRIILLGGAIPGPIDNEDDHGLVLQLQAGATSMLFPGDITIRRELELLKSGADLRSTFVLSPHHGSVTSNSAEFLRAAAPEWLIISSGTSRTSQFPASQTLETAKNLAIPILNTATHGTIVVTIPQDAHDYRLTAFSAQRQYWRSS